MKSSKNTKYEILRFSWVFILFALVSSCDLTYDLPEAGSLADETPPSAVFGHTQNEADYLQIDFANLSASATDYTWDFGDGNTSTDFEPSHTYAAEGTYTVTLKSSDKLGATSTSSQDVVVEEPIIVFTPKILEAGFEDLSLPDGTGDGRDSWKSDAGGDIQITESPVYDGTQAAKLPSAGDRVGQQLITVLKNTDYVLSFYYTMKADAGTLTVAVLSDLVTDPADVAGAAIESVDLTDNSDPSTYVKVSLPFSTGDNTEVAIYFGNSGSECRLDNFEIE